MYNELLNKYKNSLVELEGLKTNYERLVYIDIKDIDYQQAVLDLVIKLRTLNDELTQVSNSVQKVISNNLLDIDKSYQGDVKSRCYEDVKEVKEKLNKCNDYMKLDTAVVDKLGDISKMVNNLASNI